MIGPRDIGKAIGFRLNRLYYSRLGTRSFNPDGVDVFKEDWDNLLILDACRYDTFEKLSDLPGELEKRTSRSSTTDEFLRANVSGRDLRNTVYVTASPSFEKTDDVDADFHAVENVWVDHWDDEVKTVLPRTVTKFAKQAAEEYPDKRLLVHYLQPHYPFIGSTGRSEFEYEGIVGKRPTGNKKFWHTVGTNVNDVSVETVWKAYEENLEETLPHVRELIETVGGKSVITADHGEMMNDRAFPFPHRLYGHPGGFYTKELVEVPWHTYTNGDRREIVAGSEAESEEDINEKVIEQRLADLGYKN